MEGFKAYTQEELAETIGTNVQTIASLRQTGILKSIKIGKKFYFLDRWVIDFFEEYSGANLSNVEEMQKAKR